MFNIREFLQYNACFIININNIILKIHIFREEGDKIKVNNFKTIFYKLYMKNIQNSIALKHQTKI